MKNERLPLLDQGATKMAAVHRPGIGLLASFFHWTEGGSLVGISRSRCANQSKPFGGFSKLWTIALSFSWLE